MKKISLIALCLLIAVLAGCGKTVAPDETQSTAAESQTESTTAEPITWDHGDFKFVKGDLPKGWTEQEYYGTTTYLEALYGEGENAPKLTVSVLTYDDVMGAEKTRLLADAVKERESKTASEITKGKIGGLDFYQLSYDSLTTKGTRCYVFFGQTVPDENKEYNFVEIQIDHVKDAKQYETLKSVLDVLEFKF